MKNKIQRAVISLLKTEPYYAHFIMESRILLDAKGIERAAVAVINGTPTIMFNTEFLKQYDDEMTARFMKHEVKHLLLDHIEDYAKDGSDMQERNIAQDCAINQYIPGLPDWVITLPNLEKMLGKKLLPFETSDYYYEQIKSSGKSVGGAKTLDDHGVKMPGQDSPEVAKGAVKRVATNAVQRAAGNVAEHILSAIDKLGEAKLPWKVLLRNAIMSQVSRETQATTKRINRRFALPVPGKKHKRTMTLGVCVDESGSVSEEQHAAFMAEIKSIANMVNKTWLVHADCEVAAVEDLSKAKFTATRRAGGGTAYQPAIDKCKELKCNMIVYFGDFDTADKPQNPGVPFLWVGVGNQPAPGNFGKVIRL